MRCVVPIIECRVKAVFSSCPCILLQYTTGRQLTVPQPSRVATKKPASIAWPAQVVASEAVDATERCLHRCNAVAVVGVQNQHTSVFNVTVFVCVMIWHFST